MHKESFFSKLNIAEKFLLLFLIIIFAQIIYNLLFNELVMEESNQIDTVIRTSAASIFGYFLGNNIKKPKEVKQYEYNETKIKIVFLIGFISLIIILYVRNFMQINVASISSVTQLRDFVSATVGYLVSYKDS